VKARRKKEVNVLSLFDGIGAARIALDRVGIRYDNYYASEIDGYAMKIMQNNYPDTIQVGDVTKLDGFTLPKVFLLVGGSPCTGFTRRGKKLNFADRRSSLIFEYYRLLCETRPKYFLLENVFMKREWLDVISSMLGVEPIKINSSLVSGQHRVRYYWTNIEGVTLPEDKQLAFSDVLEDVIDDVPHYDEADFRKRKKKQIRMNSIAIDPDKATTVMASNARTYEGNYTVMSNGLVRRTIPLEIERLQTIPDGYTRFVSNAQRYRALGNSFTVDVIAHILNYMKGV